MSAGIMHLSWVSLDPRVEGGRSAWPSSGLAQLRPGSVKGSVRIRVAQLLDPIAEARSGCEAGFT
jgi:hypothetical protein